MTVCTELHPASAKGSTVGLFIPGSMFNTASNFSLGTLSSTYLDSLALRTDLILKTSFSKIGLISEESSGETARTASLFKMTSTSLRLFLNKVLPLETISQMASAKPIFGAISTDPLIICMSA